MSLGFLLMVNRALQARFESQASHDPMSGAYRRDAFLDVLDREIAVSVRRGVPLSMFMMDIDDFKAINDTYGHLIGDKVIADFAARAAASLRAGDVIGRYGGADPQGMAALLDAADKALYSAKRAGKNQVVAMGQT